MGILKLFSAWRHGRGFGVHSPLAYELIKYVLPDKPAYYGDSIINASVAGHRERRIARIALRLAARFNPDTVYATENTREAILQALKKPVFVDCDEKAAMSVNQTSSHVVFRVGYPGLDNGPLILEDYRDVKIIIYRKGLTPLRINVRL